MKLETSFKVSCNTEGYLWVLWYDNQLGVSMEKTETFVLFQFWQSSWTDDQRLVVRAKMKTKEWVFFEDMKLSGKSLHCPRLVPWQTSFERPACHTNQVCCCGCPSPYIFIIVVLAMALRTMIQATEAHLKTVQTCTSLQGAKNAVLFHMSYYRVLLDWLTFKSDNLTGFSITLILWISFQECGAGGSVVDSPLTFCINDELW